MQNMNGTQFDEQREFGGERRNRTSQVSLRSAFQAYPSTS